MAVRPARLLIVALAAACGGRRDPSAEIVRSLARAADHRDSAAIVASLAPDFRASSGAGREEVGAELRRLFAAYASVDVSTSNPAVHPFPEFDVVRFEATFRGRPGKIGGLEGMLPSSARYRFELRLARDGDRRTITNATWEEAAGPPP